MKCARANTFGFLALAGAIGLLAAVNAAPAQEQKPAPATAPPLSDSRLTVHTLLREDIFAGFLANDMKRFARGEQNIKLLQQQRPDQKANLLAWEAGAVLYRAVLAHEARRPDAFKQQYDRALDLFAQAGKEKAGNDGVAPITGGSYVLFADRLPKEHRAAAWTQAYDSYQILWKQQSAVLKAMPAHFRGEVMGGLIKSAQRTGHTQELNQYLDQAVVMLRNTPYESAAVQWKKTPDAASNPAITCISCHEAGRLDDRLSALDKKKPPL